MGYYRGFEEQVGEVGYILKKEFRGKGFAYEAVKAIIEVVLKNMLLKSVVAFTKSDNHKSKNLLQKLEFKQVLNLKDNYLKYQIH